MTRKAATLTPAAKAWKTRRANSDTTASALAAWKTRRGNVRKAAATTKRAKPAPIAGTRRANRSTHKRTVAGK